MILSMCPQYSRLVSRSTKTSYSALSLAVAALCLAPLRPLAAQEAVDYGAGQANTRFTASSRSSVVAEPNYLALYDEPGPSGVPLGGIGVGAVDLAPDGHFTRFAINNWATDSGVARARQENPAWDREAFLVMWERDATGTVRTLRLQRDTGSVYGMRAYAHSIYRGLFPTARISFDDGSPTPHSLVSVYAYSGLVPHDVKNSSLPGFWIDVTLANSDSNPVDAAIALSWPDLLGRGIYDVRPGQQGLGYGSAFDPDERLVPIAPSSTKVEAASFGDCVGVRQSLTAEPVIRQATFQNYTDAVAVLAESPEGGSVTTLSSWKDAEGEQAWKSFRETGEFARQQSSSTEPLSAAGGPASASAVAIRATIPGGGKKTFRFLVTWSVPEIHAASSFGTSDYGRYSQNFFPDFASLIRYEIRHRAEILKGTLDWQQPILTSTLPDWLKFELINSAYTMYTNTMLNKAGAFTVMEGGMGGLAGTMDQRIVAHPLYQKFFTQLDRTELQQFADNQDDDGGILHFDGSYFVGIADSHGHTPVPHEKMIDNTGGWLIQVASDYQQTGDLSFAKKNADHIRRGLAYMRAQIRDQSFIPVGGQTYDDFPHPPVSIYTGTVYLAALEAGEVLGRALQDDEITENARKQFTETQVGLLGTLWNGQFFAYGSDVGGGNRRDDRLFSGQLAGQFLARNKGWRDVVPVKDAQSTIAFEMRTAVANSPDYQAPKVWDLDMQRGVDMPGSRTWPFYLESYLAMPAMQMGYLADGLEIMRHTQMVNLRHGWAWTQNLWNPAELTYVAAPVTWFAPDVLANASLDLAEGRLTLGPTLLPGQQQTVIPLFFPRFWAELTYAPSEGKTLLRVIRTFDDQPIVLKKLTIEPAGTASADAQTKELKPFTVKINETLDLSAYTKDFQKSVLKSSILNRDSAR